MLDISWKTCYNDWLRRSSMAEISLKQQLLAEIDRLPEDKLPELLNFVRFLEWQQPSTNTPQSTDKLDPMQDPILRFIGGVSHGALAQAIDEELYGE
jgi:hypothetical protein